jgi:hypothetical protein
MLRIFLVQVVPLKGRLGAYSSLSTYRGHRGGYLSRLELFPVDPHLDSPHVPASS